VHLLLLWPLNNLFTLVLVF